MSLKKIATWCAAQNVPQSIQAVQGIQHQPDAYPERFAVKSPKREIQPWTPVLGSFGWILKWT